jgi:hypothetical protein
MQLFEFIKRPGCNKLKSLLVKLERKLYSDEKSNLLPIFLIVCPSVECTKGNGIF